MATALAQWGNSAGLHVPKDIMTKAKVGIGDLFDFDVPEEGKITLTLIRKSNAEIMEEMFRDYHGEMRCQEADWGGDVGREVVE